MSNKYYNVLEVDKQATLEDIKNAYRQKAKLLHPDKNKSPNAHEEFIALTEAYEILQNRKTGLVYDQEDGAYSKHTPQKRRRAQRFNKAEQQKARARAAYYAKMQYEEYIQSDYYRSIESLNTIATYIIYVFSLIVAISTPIYFAATLGIIAFTISLAVNTLVMAVLIKFLGGYKTFKLSELYGSIVQIAKTKGFKLVAVTVINILILFKIGFQTLVAPWFLIPIYIVSIVAVSFLIKDQKKSNKLKYYFNSFCIAPLIISALLVLNYVSASNGTEESYLFFKDAQATYSDEFSLNPEKSGKTQSTYIYLEKEKYSRFPGIRTFADYSELHDKEIITYTFKTGILGLRVMTDYEFHYRSRESKALRTRTIKAR